MNEALMRPSWWRLYRKHKGLLLLVAPGLLFFLIFNYLPMFGLAIVFKDFRLDAGILGSEWSGLQNFARLFGSADFPNALRNTITISVLRLVFGFFAPIALALMLNEVRISWYKRTVQMVTYIPYFLSWVILGGIYSSIGGRIDHNLRVNFIYDSAQRSIIGHVAGYPAESLCHYQLGGAIHARPAELSRGTQHQCPLGAHK